MNQERSVSGSVYILLEFGHYGPSELEALSDIIQTYLVCARDV